MPQGFQPSMQTNVAKPAVFLAHGHGQEWLQVQWFLQHVIRVRVVELAEEAALGRTIIENLMFNLRACFAAVAVVTEDHRDEDGARRPSENVLHEIGVFQGMRGRGGTILLKESGIQLPTNLSGLIYHSFNRSQVQTTFPAIAREIAVMRGGS